MCISPLTLKRDYSNSKGYMTNIVPCGKCLECLRSRANTWAFRIYNEMQQSTHPRMVTFTYADAPLSFNGHPTLVKKDFQDFLKRYRKTIDTKLKYYMCGEYGDQTKRPHYHAIMLNLPKNHAINPKHIQGSWKHGHVDIAPCNMATINYTLKYLMKGKWQALADDDDRQPNFALMSKKMGLNHLTQRIMLQYRENLQNYVTLPSGTKTAMPRYYKDLIYSSLDKKALATTAKLEADKIEETKFRDEKHKVEWKNQQIKQHNKKLKEKTKL